jgi:hypothetical protein
MILLGALAFVLAGCTGLDGKFVGSPHGYAGSGTINGERFIATPTIDGNLDPMGSRTMSPDGTVIREDMYSTYTDGVLSATGPAAWITALWRLCSVAPGSPLCTGDALN